MWSWRPPDDCRSNVSPQVVAGGETLLVVVVCLTDESLDDMSGHGQVRLVGLDDRTGAQRWRYVEAFDDLRQTPDPYLQASPRGSAAELNWALIHASGETARSRLIDTASGEVLAASERLSAFGWPSDDGWIAGRTDAEDEFELHGIDDGHRLSTGCHAPERDEMVAVADALVQLCGAFDDPDAVVVVPRTDPQGPRALPISLPADDPGDSYLVAATEVVVVVSKAGRLIGLG
jgi:hypothetical protein